ncbi:MAG: DUF6544 family protein [Bacteroidales bacterium]
MKHILSSVFFIHGAIHLMGFLSGFQLARIDQMPTGISRLQAVFWLLAFLMFVLSGWAYLAGRNYWPLCTLAAVVISTFLIAGVWADARYGMPANVLLALVAVLSISSCNIQKKTGQETSRILQAGYTANPSIVQAEDLAHLPQPVQKWLLSCGIVGKEQIYNVRVRQHALMKMKPEQKDWYTAEALQYTTTLEPAFIWTVKMKMSPLVTVSGRDRYEDGKGHMLMRVNNLVNVVNETGEKLDQGTLQRFLGELVWMPSLALSPYIQWQELDENSAIATMTYKGTSGSGTFYFNERGDFVKFVALRYMGNKADAQKLPWILTVNDYAIFDGIKVPASMQATWQLEQGDWTWLKLRISDLQFNVSYAEEAE